MSEKWTFEDERQYKQLSARRERFEKVRSSRLAAAVANCKFPPNATIPELAAGMKNNARELLAALEPFVEEDRQIDSGPSLADFGAMK